MRTPRGPVRQAGRALARLPVIGPFLRRLGRRGATPTPFSGSADYWEHRYAGGGTSGAGSYGEFSAFKADVLNAFVREHDITSVIELGCGDGHQLSLAEYPSYVGFDVSGSAVRRCRERFAGDPTKSFGEMSAFAGHTADLAISLDVIYHLVEDEVFERYMRTLFGAAQRFVVIYSSDHDEPPGVRGDHVRHRNFTSWVQRHIPDWRLRERIVNRTVADPEFFVYERAGD